MSTQILEAFESKSETKNHLERVQELTALFIKEYDKKNKTKLSKTYLERIIRASIMHDIGKAGIPESILYKEGPLDESERTIIETHPIIGAYIIEKFFEQSRGVKEKRDLEVAKNIIISHHERWNGSGYPHGLKEEKIPFEARIVSIVDTYDALISERCYKKPWEIDEALSFIKEKSGTFFDPQMVEIFLSIKDKLEELKKEQS